MRPYSNAELVGLNGPGHLAELRFSLYFSKAPPLDSLSEGQRGKEWQTAVAHRTFTVILILIIQVLVKTSKII